MMMRGLLVRLRKSAGAQEVSIVALVLGVRPEIDPVIMIGDRKVTIDKAIGRDQAQVTVTSAFLIEKKIINVDGMTELFGPVKMGLGTDTNRGGLVRVLIEAPRYIPIVAGKGPQNG